MPIMPKGPARAGPGAEGIEVRVLTRLLSDESAQGLTEYAVTVGTIVFAAIVTFIALGAQLRSYFTGVDDGLGQLGAP